MRYSGINGEKFKCYERVDSVWGGRGVKVNISSKLRNYIKIFWGEEGGGGKSLGREAVE